MLIILTGPPGAGKSTTAKLLAKSFPKSVNFSIDTVRDFIVNGNFAPWDLSKESQAQHKMTDKIVDAIIEQYLKNNYVVILDGIYSNKDFTKFKKSFGKVAGFILLPTLKTAKLRDQGRSKSQQVPHRVKPLHDNFSKNKFPNFTVIDSTKLTPKETVEQIKSSI